MKRLPTAVEQFVKAQQTIAVTELWEANAESDASPYGSHWYRAVAVMLRSGFVAAKDSGFPNRTDINRICKEANFNQHFFERIAKLLVAAKVVQADRGQRPGPVGYRQPLVDLQRHSRPMPAFEHPAAKPGTAVNPEQRRGTRSLGLKHLYNPLSVSRDVIFSR